MAFGPVFFLSGDGYPTDVHVDHELQVRLSWAFSRWTGQKDIFHPTPESFCLNDFPRRADHFATYLSKQGPTTDVILIGRSSGGRLASWYASHHPVRAVICLGYPFQNPLCGPEPVRYVHLAGLAVPTLILQGLRDEYGGRNVVENYALSPMVQVKLLDTDHNFQPSSEAWDTVARDILNFCQGSSRLAAQAQMTPTAPKGSGRSFQVA